MTLPLSVFRHLFASVAEEIMVAIAAAKIFGLVKFV